MRDEHPDLAAASPLMTTAEVAAWLRCSRRKVGELARSHGIGMDLGGSAGKRFSSVDLRAFELALRTPAQPEPAPRRRRRRRRIPRSSSE